MTSATSGPTSSTFSTASTSSTSSTAFASVSLHHFHTPILLKLDEENFLLWKQQVLATLDGSCVPESPPTSADGTVPASPAYRLYKQQDNLVVAWLLASMTTPLLTQMVGLHSATQIWTTLHTYFLSHTRSQVKKLKLTLKQLKKDKFVSTYVLGIKRTVDALASVGAPISVEDHIEAILDGLSSDYDPFVASVLSRRDPYTVAEIEALLLVQEERLERHNQVDPLTFPATAAYTSWHPANPSQEKYKNNFSGSRGTRGSGRNNNFGRGARVARSSNRGAWNNSKIFCQVCGKPGHTALHCWRWYDYQPQPPPHAHVSHFSDSDHASNEASLLGVQSTVDDPLLYPDSGATHHVTKESTVYSSKQPYHGTETVKMGNGSGLSIANIGSTSFSSSSTHKSLVLKNLLHVPLITKNLLSVSSFARDNNVFFTFTLTVVMLLIRLRKRFFFKAPLKMGYTISQCFIIIFLHPLFTIFLLLVIH